MIFSFGKIGKLYLAQAHESFSQDYDQDED